MVESIAASLRPPAHREPWRWAEEHVIIPSSAVGERWDSTESVFVREIMEAFADEGINEIAAMCSAQSAKTLTILCCLLWAICEDPGPILWVTADRQEAVKFEDRTSRPEEIFFTCCNINRRLIKKCGHHLRSDKALPD